MSRQKMESGHTSKGNQMKFCENNIWYKIDGLGYEGLAESIVSDFLQYSNITDYVRYNCESIEYMGHIYNGCKCRGFLAEGESEMTLERMFQLLKGRSLVKELVGMSVKEKIKYTVDFIENTTDMKNVGEYITLLLEVDAFFLNEDRHTHNIAFIRNERGEFRTCPVFDNGAALFSDIQNDYALKIALDECYEKIQAKPFAVNFDEQVDAAEELYGQQLYFKFTNQDIRQCMERYQGSYDEKILKRIEEVLYRQRRKYSYFFIK